jgi:hypothetical protein
VASGWARYSSQVATPKFPPPPRIAQKRSRSPSSLAVVTAPEARTTSAERRLSTAIPYLPISQPRPPPRVRPAIPVVETTPRRGEAEGRRRPVVLPPGDAALRPDASAGRIDVDALHQGEVEHQSTIGDRSAGDVVAATTDREFEPPFASEGDGVDDVSGVEAPGDDGGTLAHEAVVDASHLVVPGRFRGEDGPGESLSEFPERLNGDHGRHRGSLLGPTREVAPKVL